MNPNNSYHFKYIVSINSPHNCKKCSVTDEKSLHYRSVYHLGEGNGTPLQYSCLENPMDGEAW